MDDVERTAEDAPVDAAMDRRAFFRRALFVAGGTVGVLGLAACPNGGGEGEDDDEGGEDEDD